MWKQPEEKAFDAIIKKEKKLDLRTRDFINIKSKLMKSTEVVFNRELIFTFILIHLERIVQSAPKVENFKSLSILM